MSAFDPLKTREPGNPPKERAGFTLIELLVVISIIGLLASVVLSTVTSTRVKARDSRRLSDMRQILLGLELYRDSNNLTYPGSVASYGEGSSCGGWDTSRLDSDSDGLPFIEPLATGGFMTAVPRDPLDSSGTACGGYDYYRYNAGTSGCDANRGDFFVLGIRNMERTSGTHPASPGWSCPGRNWQLEFEWVTGGFTR